MHIFAPVIGKEGHNAAIARIAKRKSRFFEKFPRNTLFRAFSMFKLTANADPFIVIDVILLFDAVQHERLSILNQVTERCL